MQIQPLQGCDEPPGEGICRQAVRIEVGPRSTENRSWNTDKYGAWAFCETCGSGSYSGVIKRAVVAGGLYRRWIVTTWLKYGLYFPTPLEFKKQLFHYETEDIGFAKF